MGTKWEGIPINIKMCIMFEHPPFNNIHLLKIEAPSHYMLHLDVETPSHIISSTFPPQLSFHSLKQTVGSGGDGALPRRSGGTGEDVPDMEQAHQHSPSHFLKSILILMLERL